jgi:hypothetical protein
MAKLRGASFDDTLVRNAVIEFFKKRFNVELKSNEVEKKIDLLGVNDNLLGVEVEHGKWNGNFWDTDSYSLNLTGLDYRTINIPIRKEKYWRDINPYYGKEVINLSSKKNIFVRTNKDFTQFIVIRPETIRDSKKLIRTSFQPNNSDEVEDWISFKNEHVETYDLLYGEYVLQQTKKLNLKEKICQSITRLLK